MSIIENPKTLRDWYDEYQLSSRLYPTPAKLAIGDVDDFVLVMEMIKRGYAVAKLPPEELLEEAKK